MRDKFCLDETDERAAPFEGFRGRVCVLMSTNSGCCITSARMSSKKNDQYSTVNPDFLTDTRTATVWFDDIVVAKEYLGPFKQ